MSRRLLAVAIGLAALAAFAALAAAPATRALATPGIATTVARAGATTVGMLAGQALALAGDASVPALRAAIGRTARLVATAEDALGAAPVAVTRRDAERCVCVMRLVPARGLPACAVMVVQRVPGTEEPRLVALPALAPLPPAPLALPRTL